jgi:hypothetical protein
VVLIDVPKGEMTIKLKILNKFQFISPKTRQKVDKMCSSVWQSNGIFSWSELMQRALHPCQAYCITE